MISKRKVLVTVLAISIVLMQFAVLPGLTFAEESATAIPADVLEDASTNRTPIIWYDFENVEEMSSSITDKITGLEATYGDQKKVDDVPKQFLTNIQTTDYYGLNGQAFFPHGQRDLLMPYEPLSQTGDEATIQAWVMISSVNDFNDLFWAGSVKGKENVQQQNYIGIHPRRGDTKSYSYMQASSLSGGNDGAKKLNGGENVQPASAK